MPTEMWWRLVRMAQPYRGRFAAVALFAALGSAAALLEPLIYREAVNDVAGVFVQRGVGGPNDHPTLHGAWTPEPVVRVVASQGPGDTSPPARHAPREPHRRGHIAPRTVEQMFRTLLWAVVLLFVTGLATELFGLLADNTCATAANRIEEDFIRRTFDHVLRLRIGFFSQRATGALASQIDQSDQLAPIITSFAKDILPEIFRVVGTFAIMFTQSPRLTAAALATLPAYFFIARRSAKDLESNLPKYFSLWEEVSTRIRDAIAAIKTVKVSGAESREVARLSAASHDAYATFLERNRLANRYLFWQSLLQQLGQALVLGYGGWRVLERQLTPGDVVMFVTYLDRLYAPIDSLTSLSKNLQQHLVSLRRALALLDTTESEPAGAALAPGPGRVEFQDVHFGYVPEREVLRGLSCTLEPDRVTALVGPSGAGKTTLVDLLLRLREPTSGSILLDGQPLSAVDPASVRQAVSVVLADGAVFRGSLADNIRYQRSDATDEEVRTAALAAGLGRALERLPDGLVTQIGEGGVGLSVGERQRLQLARAFVSRPRILILDEATANLDYAMESEIKEALSGMRCGRTTLVIAHRYSMAKDADRVLVLDGGRIVEQGTPEELLVTGGWFAQLAAGTAIVGDGGTGSHH